MKKNHRIAPEVKEQILRRIKDEGVPVAQATKEHGVSEANIYNWLGKGVRNAPSMGDLARTIADLEGSPDIKESHLSEAIQYRTLDRNLWM